MGRCGRVLDVVMPLHISKHFQTSPSGIFNNALCVATVKVPCWWRCTGPDGHASHVAGMCRTLGAGAPQVYAVKSCCLSNAGHV